MGCPLWLARQVAQIAADLSLARALWLDRTLTPVVTRLGPGRILRLAAALVAQADPAQADRRRARTARRVELGGTRDGVRDVCGTIDAADGVYLQAALQTTHLGTIPAHDDAEADAEAEPPSHNPVRRAPTLPHALTSHVGKRSSLCPGMGA